MVVGAVTVVVGCLGVVVGEVPVVTRVVEMPSEVGGVVGFGSVDAVLELAPVDLEAPPDT